MDKHKRGDINEKGYVVCISLLINKTVKFSHIKFTFAMLFDHFIKTFVMVQMAIQEVNKKELSFVSCGCF